MVRCTLAGVAGSSDPRMSGVTSSLVTASNFTKRGSVSEPSPDEIRRAVAGDIKVFRALVERYQGMVYAVAFRILGDHMDAEDAAQEAFLRCYKKLAQYRGEAAFSTWLFRLAVAAACDVGRRKCRQREVPVDTVMESPSEPVESGVAPAIISGLRRLPEGQRVPVVLRDIYGLPYQEIAEVIGRPLSTVKVMVYRGRMALRSHLLSEGLAPSSVCGGRGR